MSFEKCLRELASGIDRAIKKDIPIAILLPEGNPTEEQITKKIADFSIKYSGLQEDYNQQSKKKSREYNVLEAEVQKHNEETTPNYVGALETATCVALTTLSFVGNSPLAAGSFAVAGGYGIVDEKTTQTRPKARKVLMWTAIGMCTDQALNLLSDGAYHYNYFQTAGAGVSTIFEGMKAYCKEATIDEYQPTALENYYHKKIKTKEKVLELLEFTKETLEKKEQLILDYSAELERISNPTQSH